jgi:hypothetical protein
MSVTQRVAAVSAAAAVLVVLICAVVFWPQGRKQHEARQPKEPQKVVARDGEPAEDGLSASHKPQRATGAAKTHVAANGEQKAKATGGDYGRTPPVPVDANPQVKMVAEAIRQKNHAERISAMIPPTPFDANAYKVNPASYTEVVEPGRVFHPAQPGPGVPVLRSISPQLQQMNQGESTSLRVNAAPGAPVSFTSFDLGRFDNQLTSITVQANAQGVAEAKFYAPPGTYNNVNILAASPMASGQTRFVVNVQVPGVTGPAPAAASK